MHRFFTLGQLFELKETESIELGVKITNFLTFFDSFSMKIDEKVTQLATM